MMLFKNMKPSDFVEYIAQDLVELSHEKIKVQRDDYIRQARQIVKEMPKSKSKSKVLNDDF